ncbi:hypothetical protein M3649_03840 [Ureibacillus chungkukjangi]|uniref:hypothetical protein n=1 Tax=Ureibacillus chungkukjangi TaxID=1202712 RepID=UPI0020423FE7|nr:hypothetical protein [Ureibacillus chungkukjangi]MCM3387263.1 hypothetical protein [Ureibacillus chungkukjangi]
MKVKFKVHHTYGLHYEEVFDLDDFNVDYDDKEQFRKDMSELLTRWTMKHYNHGDALPSWEIVEGDE